MVLSSWVIGGEFSKATVYKVRAKVRGGPTVLVAWPGLARGPSVAPYPRPGQTVEGLVTTAGCVRECLPSQSLSSCWPWRAQGAHRWAPGMYWRRVEGP